MIDVNKLIELVKEAGRSILDIYDAGDFEKTIDFKTDNSPLTLADKASHEILYRGLSSMYPEIPVLSEEGKETTYHTRKAWRLFWLVDPLDGTKEFIKRNGEFTINIALVDDHFPVFGLVYTPVTGTFYIGDLSTNEAYRLSPDGNRKLLAVNNKSSERIAVRSRSHPSDEEEKLLQSFGVSDFISVGSALKFCMVADGKADIYYRHGPTMEWDSAAGQAVVEAAGGEVLSLPDNQRFSYNKESLKNGSFLVKGF